MLYLVRHGRTAANAAGQLQGRLDQDLDDVGRAQADSIAELIGDVDEVISSPLRRAQQTAERFQLPIITDDRWIELSYGEYEGAPVGDVPQSVWASWRSDPDFKTRGGESFAELDARVRSACSEILDRMADLDVVVVSHVSPIKSAFAWALDVAPETMWRTHLSQASLTRIGIRRGQPIVHSFNEISY